MWAIQWTARLSIHVGVGYIFYQGPKWQAEDVGHSMDCWITNSCRGQTYFLLGVQSGQKSLAIRCGGPKGHCYANYFRGAAARTQIVIAWLQQRAILGRFSPAHGQPASHAASGTARSGARSQG
jgi:hypothetical protein